MTTNIPFSVTPNPNQSPPERYTRGDWVLLLAAIVLIIAGALKGYDLLRGAVLNHYFFHTADVMLELAAGVWFISSVAAFYARRAGILLFTIFLCVSIFRGWQGQTDCGCFGPVPMNPWITATMDGLILLLFTVVQSNRPRTGHTVRWRKALAGLMALVIVTAGIGGGFYLCPAMLHANGKLTGGRGVVLMQPPAWNGKRFPLAAYVSGSRLIMHGQWLAVIYFHTCPVCQHTIAEITRRLKLNPRHQVALIELPPYGPLPKGIVDPKIVRLKLKATRLWHPPFLPVLVDLNNGKVTRVRSYIPGAWYGF